MTTSGQDVYNQSQIALHPCFVATTLNILGCQPGKISSFLQPVKDDPGLETVCVCMAFTFECHEVYIVQTVPTFASDSWVSWQCHSTASHNNFRTPNSCTIILFTLIRSSARQLRFSLSSIDKDGGLVETDNVRVPLDEEPF